MVGVGVPVEVCVGVTVFVGVLVGWGETLAVEDAVTDGVALLVEAITDAGLSSVPADLVGDELVHALSTKLMMRARVKSQWCFFMGKVLIKKNCANLGAVSIINPAQFGLSRFNPAINCLSAAPR